MKYWTGVQRGKSYLIGARCLFSLMGARCHPSSDGVMIKMPYGVDVLHQPASHPIFLVKIESGFIVSSVETGLGR